MLPKWWPQHTYSLLCLIQFSVTNLESKMFILQLFYGVLTCHARWCWISLQCASIRSKRCHFYFCNNLFVRGPILIILSLLYSAVNCGVWNKLKEKAIAILSCGSYWKNEIGNFYGLKDLRTVINMSCFVWYWLLFMFFFVSVWLLMSHALHGQSSWDVSSAFWPMYVNVRLVFSIEPI